MKDVLGYEGKKVVITGAASGMGASAAQLLVDLGAEVHALDIGDVTAPVSQSIKTDMRDRASIDAAVAALPGEIDVLFNCAGVPHPPASPLDTFPTGRSSTTPRGPSRMFPAARPTNWRISWAMSRTTSFSTPSIRSSGRRKPEVRPSARRRFIQCAYPASPSPSRRSSDCPTSGCRFGMTLARERSPT